MNNERSTGNHRRRKKKFSRVHWNLGDCCVVSVPPGGGGANRRLVTVRPPWRGGVGLGWAGGLLQEQSLGRGPPSLPNHEAEQPDCPVPRPSGLSTATRPHRSAGGRKIPSSCVWARARAGEGGVPWGGGWKWGGGYHGPNQKPKEHTTATNKQRGVRRRTGRGGERGAVLPKPVPTPVLLPYVALALPR